MQSNLAFHYTLILFDFTIQLCINPSLHSSVSLELRHTVVETFFQNCGNPSCEIDCKEHRSTYFFLLKIAVSKEPCPVEWHWKHDVRRKNSKRWRREVLEELSKNNYPLRKVDDESLSLHRIQLVSLASKFFTCVSNHGQFSNSQ